MFIFSLGVLVSACFFPNKAWWKENLNEGMQKKKKLKKWNLKKVKTKNLSES